MGRQHPSEVRLEQEKLCLLVMIGVRADDRKELVALTDGFRESQESWADLLCDCRRRGMRAPVLAVGDGALGFPKAMREVFDNAEDIDKAQLAIKAFEIDYGARFPKAVATITGDADALLEFYRCPAEHWIPLRTANPIESTLATVRVRTKVTKAPAPARPGSPMAFKLIEAAQNRWRAVNAPHLVAVVRNGAQFHNGKLLERPVGITPKNAAESGAAEVA